MNGDLVTEQCTTLINWDARGLEAGVHELMVAAYTTEGSNMALRRREDRRSHKLHRLLYAALPPTSPWSIAAEFSMEYRRSRQRRRRLLICKKITRVH